MGKAISPARAVAFEILLLVERGGYAGDLLASRAAGLDPRDAGLASEIALGSLRWQGELDFLIEHFAGRPAGRLDPEVRAALRMGIYQLRHLDRVPPHAAVSESVELVKRARKRSAAAMVNAVLRKVDRSPVVFPGRAIELSHPAWLLERWERQFGPEAATAIARANLAPPKTYVRLRGIGLLACLPGETGREAYPTGRIQDINSQAIVPLLELQPGLTFLDLCAAPGNKTAQALEAGVRAVACDIHLSRLNPLKTLGCDLVLLDGAVSLPFRRLFDRILADVPCSGTGTLARNPEIKWRLQPSNLIELHRLQVRLLRNALQCLAPGGVLVYSTCSLEREENEDVVEEALGRPPERIWRRTPGLDPGDGFFAAVIRSE